MHMQLTLPACCVCGCCGLQGLGTAVLAAILGGLPKTGGSIADHTILFSGVCALNKLLCGLGPTSVLV
jgi:hypothetical protein